jgi:hypothetical protein
VAKAQGPLAGSAVRPGLCSLGLRLSRRPSLNLSTLARGEAPKPPPPTGDTAGPSAGPAQVTQSAVTGRRGCIPRRGTGDSLGAALLLYMPRLGAKPRAQAHEAIIGRPLEPRCSYTQRTVVYPWLTWSASRLATRQRRARASCTLITSHCRSVGGRGGEGNDRRKSLNPADCRDPNMGNGGARWGGGGPCSHQDLKLTKD